MMSHMERIYNEVCWKVFRERTKAKDFKAGRRYIKELEDVLTGSLEALEVLIKEKYPEYSYLDFDDEGMYAVHYIEEYKCSVYVPLWMVACGEYAEIPKEEKDKFFKFMATLED